MSASDVIGSERMEALLRGDAPRSGAEERRAALLDGLRAPQLRAPEALRARVLAAAPAPAQRASWLRRPSRRLALVVVPLAAALAVGAALVHGLVGSGGGSPRPVPVASPVQSHTLEKLPATGAAPRPPQTTSTIVRSAPATSSSPSGSCPSTQPVRISSRPP